MSSYQNDLAYAKEQDRIDPLRSYRERFYIPTQKNGEEHIYLCGNSLGLQPKAVKENIDVELEDWKRYGVEGHLHARNPWLPYHEFLTEAMAEVVGAKKEEIVVMNTLTVNLHLMLVSFYRPKGARVKVIIEADAFPSDKFAVESQMEMHGIDPSSALIQLKPNAEKHCLDPQQIINAINETGEELALVMMGNTNYYTGQYFDMQSITRAAHAVGAKAGFDCAHGAGNQDLQLHESGADFAVWCSYKYLNSGPGSLGGCFVHERHRDNGELIRLKGWWGHNKETRFQMRDDFQHIHGAEGWQLSNPPILSMASVKASLDIFKEVGIKNLRKKADHLTAYMEHLVLSMESADIEIITPSDPSKRGSQLSIYVKNADRNLFHKITEKGVIADWREPGVIRVAPTALYNSYADVYRFVDVLRESM